MFEIARREFTKLVGASAATATVPEAAFGAPLEANKIRLNDGSIHAVSAQWYQRNVVSAGVQRENERRRVAILELSNERHHTSQLHPELAALTEFKNVNRAHALLRGRDYREVFGASWAIDQVHINRVTKPCAVNSTIFLTTTSGTWPTTRSIPTIPRRFVRRTRHSAATLRLISRCCYAHRRCSSTKHDGVEFVSTNVTRDCAQAPERLRHLNNSAS